VRRLDLGLLEAILWALIAVVIVASRRHLSRTGTMTALVISLYGIGRFMLDFLRVEDARYVLPIGASGLGLTPAQYGSIILVLVGVSLLARRKSEIRNPKSETNSKVQVSNI
jgi:prolipoprotein diacylglyceryltransferase